LFVPIAQGLTGDSRISRYLRDRATQKFRLGQVVDDVVDFSVGMNAMREFDHPLKRGNHFEGELDPQKQTEIFLTTTNEGDFDEI
jgi:hypothetical protein